MNYLLIIGIIILMIILLIIIIKLVNVPLKLTKKEKKFFKEIKFFITKLKEHVQKNIILKKYNNKNLKIFKKLIKNVDINNIYANRKETYSINKKFINFCIKTNSINVLKYVIMHEIAHIINEIYGHNNEFWCIFKKIINESIKSKLYVPINYKNHPQLYCNKFIEDNIYYSQLECN